MSIKEVRFVCLDAGRTYVAGRRLAAHRFAKGFHFNGDFAMNTKRKIQWAAAAVLVNSVSALSLLPSGVAFATTCNPGRFCVSEVQCIQTDQSICAANTPPGCTLSTYL